MRVGAPSNGEDVHSSGITEVRLHSSPGAPERRRVELELRPDRCFKRVEYGQAVLKSGKIDKDGDRRPFWSDHGKLAVAAPEAVVRLYQRGEAARVDEADVAEIDDKPGSVPVSRVG